LPLLQKPILGPGPMSNYQSFLETKLHTGANHGFKPMFMPDALFDFQAAMAEYAITKGRAALFEDCGLGKTIQFLTWGQNVVQHTNKPVLALTPLAVTAQTIREAEKFGIEAVRSNDGKVSGKKIFVTNYEKLHYFNWQDFGGVICDESSCLKSADAARRQDITDFMRKVLYRLLCTATAAPNDYLELGTSSESLGYLGFMDMLNRFFKNDSNNSAMRRMYGEAPKWRFRGHAEIPFWQWVCSWARAIRKPSDMGFDDRDFILPPLREEQHVVEARSLAPGMLFALPARNLPEQREEKKRTLTERCQKMAELMGGSDSFFIGCHLNDEGDLLEKLLPQSVQVSGSDSDETKEEKFMAFVDGQAKGLITKGKIGAWGLNFQHCAHIGYFPSHSYEQYYQFVRRCWRFGQKRPVRVDLVLTEGERKIMDNLHRKAVAADKMFTALVEQMNNAVSIERENNRTNMVEVPKWL
jgi:hypothetical protein